MIALTLRPQLGSLDMPSRANCAVATLLLLPMLLSRTASAQMPGTPLLQNAFASPGIAAAFDVASITNAIDQAGSFGTFSGVLTNPRVMQFALRYEF